jgi:hypothetical protein
VTRTVEAAFCGAIVSSASVVAPVMDAPLIDHCGETVRVAGVVLYVSVIPVLAGNLNPTALVRAASSTWTAAVNVWGAAVGATVVPILIVAVAIAVSPRRSVIVAGEVAPAVNVNVN